MLSNDVIHKRMNILSFDIGIKNLSYCLVEGETSNNHIIKDWGIWDLRLGENESTTIKPTCCGKTKNNKKCRLKPLYVDNRIPNKKIFYCKNHKNIHTCKFDEDEIKVIGKMKKSELLELVDVKKIEIGDYSSVHELRKKIKEYAQNDCLMKIKKKKKCKTFPLDKLHQNLYHYIHSFLQHKEIHLVQIENQPVRINATMKTIQIMLYSIIHTIYYQRGCSSPKITFLNAKHKGTVYDGEQIQCSIKDPYRRRKYLSIEHSKYFLDISQQSKWEEYFSTNSKKDDLADAYLMCLFALKED